MHDPLVRPAQSRRRAVGIALGAIAGAVLLLANPAGRPANSGSDPRAELDAWVAEARRRGEPTEWREIVGEPIPDEANGALLLDEVAVVGDAIRDGLPPLPQASALPDRWEPNDLQRITVAVQKLTPYFQGLQSAARLDKFVPRIGTLPTGALLKPQNLSTAWRLLSIRASLGSRQAVDAGLWLLETARKWHVRTRIEGRLWERAIWICLHILHRAGACRDFEIDERSTAALDKGLRDAEEEFIRTLRRRIYARCYLIVWTAREYLDGRDPIGEAERRLAEMFRSLNADRPDGVPALVLQRPGLPDYAANPQLAVREALAGLAAYAPALEAIPDLDAIREMLREERGRGSVAKYWTDVDEFARWLTLIAELRVARLGLAVAAHRDVVLRGNLEVDRRIGLDETSNPRTGKPFVLDRTGNWLSLRRDPTDTAILDADTAALLEWDIETK